MDKAGIGGYEAKQMTPNFIEVTTKEAINNLSIPTFDELDNDTWDFDTMKGFQFSYLFVKFVDQQYGIDHLNQLIRNLRILTVSFNVPRRNRIRRWLSL